MKIIFFSFTAAILYLVSTKSNAMIPNNLTNENVVDNSSYKNKVINKLLPILKDYEGYEQFPYLDAVDKMTVGYGHLIVDDEDFSNGVNKQEASDLLYLDIKIKYDQIYDLIQYELTINQFVAILSLVFNIGVGAFSRSTLLRMINQSDFDGAELQFARWNKGTVNGQLMVINGLSIRRERERQIFMS